MRWSWSSIGRRGSVTARPSSGLRPIAPGVDGALTDALDQLEHRIAGLLAHDLAEHPTEQADVVAEGGVLAGVDLDGDLGGCHGRTLGAARRAVRRRPPRFCHRIRHPPRMR